MVLGRHALYYVCGIDICRVEVPRLGTMYFARSPQTERHLFKSPSQFLSRQYTAQ